jgi:hypothetical protein
MVKDSKINIVVAAKRIVCLHQHLKVQETSELAGGFISFKNTDIQECDSQYR